MTHNNPNLKSGQHNAYAQLGQIPSICSQNIERKRNLKITMDRNCVVYLQILTHNDPNADLVNVNACTKQNLIKFHQFVHKILSGNNSYGP